MDEENGGSWRSKTNGSPKRSSGSKAGFATSSRGEWPTRAMQKTFCRMFSTSSCPSVSLAGKRHKSCLANVKTLDYPRRCAIESRSMSPNDSTIARFAGEIHGQRVLSFRGPLTLQNLASFQTALQVEEAPIVIIDFAEVPYVDSAGLGSIVRAHVSRHKAGKQMILTGVNDRVRKLFEITGVEPLFLIFPSIDGAIDALVHPASA